MDGKNGTGSNSWDAIITMFTLDDHDLTENTWWKLKERPPMLYY